jgi:hypothetical protein
MGGMGRVPPRPQRSLLRPFACSRGARTGLSRVTELTLLLPSPGGGGSPRSGGVGWICSSVAPPSPPRAPRTPPRLASRFAQHNIADAKHRRSSERTAAEGRLCLPSRGGKPGMPQPLVRAEPGARECGRSGVAAAPTQRSTALLGRRIFATRSRNCSAGGVCLLRNRPGIVVLMQHPATTWRGTGKTSKKSADACLFCFTNRFPHRRLDVRLTKFATVGNRVPRGASETD